MKQSAFNFKRLSIALIFAFLLPLTACGSAGSTDTTVTVGELNQEIWVYKWDYWKAVIIWSFDSSEWQLIGNGIDWQVLLKTLQAEDRGVMAKLQKQNTPNGNVIYIIELVGRGMDELNLQAFNGNAVFDQQNGQWHLLMSGQPLANPKSYHLRSYQLTIHGGDIISANTISYANGMAQWVDPDSVEMRMTGRFHLGELVPIILALNPDLKTTIPGGVIAVLGILALLMAGSLIQNKTRRASSKTVRA